MVYDTLKALGSALFPPSCVLCGADGDLDMDLCAACRRDLPVIGPVHCYRCGNPFAAQQYSSSGPILCGHCLNKPPHFDQVIAPLSYEPPVDWLVQQLKFHNRFSHVRLLSRLLSDHLAQHLSEMPQIIIPVPLHEKRLLERGFNQALEIARPIGKHFNIPIVGNYCRRTRDTLQQSALPADKRAANMRNAFIMKKKLHAKNIAIIDDVITTGATVNAMAKLLKQSGANRIQVWAVARTVLASQS